MLEFLLGVIIGSMALYLMAAVLFQRYLNKIQQAVDERNQEDLIIRARVEQIGNQCFQSLWYERTVHRNQQRVC